MPPLERSARLSAVAFAPFLVLMVAFGLGACSKKPSANHRRPAEQMPKSDSKKKLTTPDKSAMTNDDSPVRPVVMERPAQGPDAGTVTPKANKGMIAQMKLVDPNE